MKSAVLYAARDLRIEERDVPTAGAGELLIKVMASGVCGTDVHIYEGDKGSAEVSFPIVLGHEYAGIVEQVGVGVQGFQVGDRVCVDPNVLCGHCYYCLAGLGHFCENMTVSGIMLDGGFGQYAVVPARAAYKLADTVSFEAGAMAEPLACCLHAIDMCNLTQGDTVVVMGGGLIGLLMVQLANLAGAAQVVLIEPSAAKRAFGAKLGADLCIDPMAEDVKAAIEQAGISRVNAVIECVGKPQTIELAIEIAGKKSVVMMFGLTKPDETVSILPFEIFRKEVEIKSSFINPYTIGRAVSLINTGKIDVTSMIAEIVPLERLDEVITDENLRSRGKFVVAPWM
ncbi:MAG: zinc-dependent alcohol dehydrogenase family protein [Oscillospiraceae bacterium]|nr:zinc-dependent alcohol dehydrogenase family protein [Oscillospiraceae bacterium]